MSTFDDPFILMQRIVVMQLKIRELTNTLRLEGYPLYVQREFLLNVQAIRFECEFSIIERKQFKGL